MANYPTSLDTFTNPSAGNTLDSPSHSLQHSDVNDAVEALEEKIGIGASPAGSATAGQVLTAQGGGTALWATPDAGAWTSYTPTFSAFTTGNGIVDFAYSQIGKTVVVQGYVQLGSTSSVGTDFKISFPVTPKTYGTTTQNLGTVLMLDAGTSLYNGTIRYFDTSDFRVQIIAVSGSNIITASITSTSPFTWATGDQITCTLIYEAA